MQTAAIATVLKAYVAARWRERRLRTRDDIGAYHARRLVQLQRHAARELPFYRGMADLPFDAWPVIDKVILLKNFAAMNRAGLGADEARRTLAVGGERLAGHLVGTSTGTSGNRGLYVIAESERFVWLGTLLAKALPDALLRRHRVALALPATAGLYDSAGFGSRVALRFFPLAAGPETWVDALEDFAPDTIVGAPKALRWLAERGRLGAERIFTTAEVLDPLDRRVMEAATGRRVREIYMATEGLFGVSCPLGTLHLAEDVVHFEFTRPDPAGTLVSPLVTDFTRRAQAMIRYRMNDLLDLDPSPCACGSAFQAVRHVEGRSDDAFLLAAVDGALRLVTPDVVRNAIVGADPAILDFRAVQTEAASIAVTLDAHVGGDADARVCATLQAALAPRGIDATVTVTHGIVPDFTRKLRRVTRAWRPPGQH